MISPELLRRYPFFGFLTSQQLKDIAMITDEVELKSSEKLYESSQAADSLYLLMHGGIDLYYIVLDENEPDLSKEFLIGEVNPGDAFGFSSLIEPYIYTTSAVITKDGKALRVNVNELRKFFVDEKEMALGFMTETAKAIMQHLQATRVQLAASRP